PDEDSGVVAFFSCSKGQFAFEDEKLGHGVFFHHVIDGLSGAADGNKDGRITRLELEEYVRTSMEQSKQTARQSPVSAGAVNPTPALVEVHGGGGVPSGEAPGGYEKFARLTGHSGPVNWVTFAPSGRHLYSSCSNDGNVIRWEVE